MFHMVDPKVCRCKNKSGTSNVFPECIGAVTTNCIPTSYKMTFSECKRMCWGAESAHTECQIWFDCHIDKDNLNYFKYGCGRKYVSPNTGLISVDAATKDMTVHLNKQNHFQ